MAWMSEQVFLAVSLLANGGIIYTTDRIAYYTSRHDPIALPVVGLLLGHNKILVTITFGSRHGFLLLLALALGLFLTPWVEHHGRH